MGQSIVNIRMDENLKRRFEFVCNELGMNVSTAVTVFAKQVCRDGCIPFQITLRNDYKEGKIIMPQVAFVVEIYSDIYLDERYVTKIEYNSLEDMIEDLPNQFDRVEDEWNSSDIEELNRSFICFAISILNFDEHSHLIVDDDEGLFYVKDNVRKKLNYKEPFEEDDGALFVKLGYISGFIDNLIN